MSAQQKAKKYLHKLERERNPTKMDVYYSKYKQYATSQRGGEPQQQPPWIEFTNKKLESIENNDKIKATKEQIQKTTEDLQTKMKTYGDAIKKEHENLAASLRETMEQLIRLGEAIQKLPQPDEILGELQKITLPDLKLGTYEPKAIWTEVSRGVDISPPKNPPPSNSSPETPK